MTNILKGLKAVAALGLIICLFLPMSRCTSPSDDRIKKESVVYERYVVMHKDMGVQGYIPVLFFALPLVIVLLNIKVQRQKLRYELLEFLLGLMALSVVILHMTTAKLLIGGYLAMSASIVYMATTLVEIWNTMNDRRINGSAGQSDNTDSSDT